MCGGSRICSRCSGKIPIHGAHLQTTSNGLKENLRESFYGEKIVYVVDILYFCNIIYV